MTIAVSRTAGLPAAVYALSVGSFGIGTTEFVIMGLLLDVAHDFHSSQAHTAHGSGSFPA